MASGTQTAVGNGTKWYNPANVIRVLFWLIFSGLVGWGTYVFAVANGARDLATATSADNRVQDEQIKNINKDLEAIQLEQREMRMEQREMRRGVDELLRRVPR